MNDQFSGRRFGRIAVEKGYITKGQLLDALKIQVEEDLEGMEHRLVGTVLFSMGHLTMEQIIDVLEVIKEEQAGATSNGPGA